MLAAPSTVAVISELDTTLNVAAAPLKVAAVAPVKFVPMIVIVDSTLGMTARFSQTGGAINSVEIRLSGEGLA